MKFFETVQNNIEENECGSVDLYQLAQKKLSAERSSTYSLKQQKVCLVVCFKGVVR